MAWRTCQPLAEAKRSITVKVGALVCTGGQRPGNRPCRSLRMAANTSLLAIWLICAPLLAHESDLEPQIQAIERLNVTATREASEQQIAEFLRQNLPLTREQRYRLALLEARNLALEGRSEEAIALMRKLTAEPVPAALRLRALVQATNFATNFADYSSAFVWLKQALDLRDQTGQIDPRLLGIASYLHVRVGEEQKGLEFAEQAVAATREAGNARNYCLALSDYGLALSLTGEPARAEATQREQIGACERAADPVFLADAHRGVGRALLEQGKARAALPWLRNAIARFDAAGFVSGTMEARMLLAEALLGTGAPSAEAGALLEDVAPHFQQRQHWRNIERVQRLLGDVSEGNGELEASVQHLRRALQAGRRADSEARERRLAFLQVQFDTSLKEQQIALLENQRALQESELEAARRSNWIRALGISSLVLVSCLLALLVIRSSRERQQFRELSEHDGLTGLCNHQHTLRLGQRAFELSREGLRPFTAIVADIDHFKQINDRFGHAAGDTVLRTLGHLLREAFPPAAIIGRSGGEEFTVLLQATAEQARFLIEGLRQQILPLSAAGQRIEYSLSFGVCEATARVVSFEEMLREADKALYAAKRGGRDRVVNADETAAVDRPEPGLIVVGSGPQPARHLSQRALQDVEEADSVFCLLPHAAFVQLQEVRSDAVDLTHHLCDIADEPFDPHRIEDRVMASVRAGQRACVVVSSGLIAISLQLLKRARQEGHRARCEAGVSAESILCADLALESGVQGLQSLEAQVLLEQERQIDNRSQLLVWLAPPRDERDAAHSMQALLSHLQDRLQMDYPAGHEIVIYFPASADEPSFRAQSVGLCELGRQKLHGRCALVVAPRADHAPDVRSELGDVLRAYGQNHAARDSRPLGSDTSDDSSR